MVCTISNELWRLPKNYVELVDSVSWAAGDKLALKVDAPLWVTAELAEQETSNTRLLHLINFRCQNPVGEIAVQICIPEGQRLREAMLHTPEGSSGKALNASVQEGIASFRVPHLQEYALVRLRLEKN